MRRGSYTIALLVFACSLGYFGSFVEYGINFEDEGTLLYQIERLADGQTPYLDFHIGYTPAIYYLHAAVLKASDFSIIPGRWLLALVNSTSASLLVLLAVRVAPLWVSWLPAALYLAFIPNHAGEFASFNIPYPVWYNMLFFLSGLLCLLRFGEGGSKRWVFVAGLLAGIDFMFKPNVGLLHLAAASFVVLSAIPQNHYEYRGWARRVAVAWWWLMWAATLGGVCTIFSAKLGLHEALIFLLPVTLAALTVVWRAGVSGPLPSRPGIISSSLVLGGAFFAVNLPWIVLVLDRLGTQRFLVDVLFLGAGFEKFYYIAHPAVFLRAAMVGGLSLATMMLPRWLVKRGLRPEWILAGGFAASIFLFWAYSARALMPEGFARAITSQQEAGVFPVSVLVLWASLLVWMRRIGVDEESRSPSFVQGTMVIGALLMYLQIYPRTDYMHWVSAAPMVLVLAAPLVAGVAGVWGNGKGRWGRYCTRLIWMLPLVGLLCVRIIPPFLAVYDGGTDGASTSYERLDNDRAPIWTNIGRARRFQEISTLARFLRSETSEGEKVFTFPMLDLVSFLSDRHNPTRHGYFYPYWPGRSAEAEVVTQLEERPPRFAVVYHDHAMFFVQAPIYYYAVGKFLSENYHPYARIGRYTVLAHNTSGPAGAEHVLVYNAQARLREAGAMAWMEKGLSSDDRQARLATLDRIAKLRLEDDVSVVTAALEDSEPEVRDHAVWALRYSRSRRTVDSLIRAVRRRALSPRETVVALRTAAAVAGTENVRQLLPLLKGYGARVYDETASALFHAANRALARSFWLHSITLDTNPLASVPRRFKRKAMEWVGDDYADHRLRIIGVWLVSASRRARAESVLADTRRHRDLDLKLNALLALLLRGYGRGIGRSAVDLLAFDDMLAPRLVILASNDGRLDGAIARAINAPFWNYRINAAWLASVAGGTRTVRALGRSLSDPQPEMRKAALWSLQELGAVEYLGAVVSLETDPDYGVRDFAFRAAKRLASLKVQ